MNVLYFGCYHKDYSRNVINIKSLRLNGVNVYECVINKPGFTGLSQIKNIIFLSLLPVHFVGRSLVLLYKGIVSVHKSKADLIITGFPGLFELPVAYVLSRVVRKPLLFDSLISIYDTYVLDRKIFGQSSTIAKILYFLEKTLYKLPDGIIVDTLGSKDFLISKFLVRSDKIHILYVGADDDLYKFESDKVGKSDGFQVLYFGQYTPLHGVQYIIECAKIIEEQNKSIKFILVGRGQTYLKNRKLANDLNLTNISFYDQVPESHLKNIIKKAHITLGIFDDSEKARRVIPNKIFQSIAMGKVILTAASPAVGEVFKNKRDCILCKSCDASSLAEAIKYLKDNPEAKSRIGANGYALYKAKFTPKAIGVELINICRAVL